MSNNEDARMSDTSPPTTPTYASNPILVDSPPPSQVNIRDTPPASGKHLTTEEGGSSSKDVKNERSFAALNNPQHLRDVAQYDEKVSDRDAKIDKFGDPFDESSMYKK